MTNPGLSLFSAGSQITLYGVLGLAMFLLLGRGLYTVALGVVLLGLIVQAIPQRGLALGGSQRALVVISAILFVQGLVMAREAYGISPYPIFWCVITALGVCYMPGRKYGSAAWIGVVSLILVVFVFANVTFNLLWTHWPRYGRFGLFSNLHYMALYSVMTLPILAYTLISAPSLRVRCVMALTLLGNVWLLLETRSRPGYLAVIGSALVVLPWMALRFRWRIFMLMAGILALLYLGNLANFSTRVDDFVAHFGQDERWEIWVEAVRFQQGSSGLQWLLGHGIGAFFHDFREIALPRGIKTYLSPHNFFMEILYSHGILGLILVTGAYGLFLYRLAMSISSNHSAFSRQAGLMILSVATAQLIHGFSTVPFFSRDYLLPLGFVLGAGLLFVEKPSRAT